MKAVWYIYPNENKLLLAAHHTIVDGVSWRIILDDLHTACTQLLNKKDIQLIKPSATYRQWSNHLHHLASQSSVQNELPYWKNVLNMDDELLCHTKPEACVYGNRKSLAFQLGGEFVHPFLHEAHSSYQTEPNDLLLTALAVALHRWKETQKTLIVLEHHGRDFTNNNLMIDRTVGWFTGFYPFCLIMPNHPDDGYQIKSIKESLRTVPQKGVGYGLLKYLYKQQKPSGIPNQPKPFLSFNYLGHLPSGSENALFSIDTETQTGSLIDGSLHCMTPLSIEAVIVGSQFHGEIQYDAKLFAENDISMFQSAWRQALLQVVEHCVSQTTREITPSDVSHVAMNLEEFDALFQD